MGSEMCIRDRLLSDTLDLEALHSVSLDSPSFVIYPEMKATENISSFIKLNLSVAFISG